MAPEGAGGRTAEAGDGPRAEAGPSSGEGSCFWMGKGTLKVPMSLHAHSRMRALDALRSAVAEDPGLAAAGPLVALLQGGSANTRYCTDTEILFRQESYMAYLFGVTEPDFYGALDLASGRSMIFMPRLPESYAVWMGSLLTPQDFKAKYEVDQVHYVDELEEVLAGLGGDEGVRPTLLLLQGLNTDSGKHTAPATFKGIEAFVCNTSVLHPVLSECRVIKSPAELRVLRYAAAVSSDAHVHVNARTLGNPYAATVMQQCRPGMMEYELEAKFLHSAYAHGGCRYSAYTCICACGPNSAVLHYGHAAAPNDRCLGEGEMALLDMGAEYSCYGADITCSFPVGGRFTDNQRMVYSAVLAAQKAVYQEMRPGTRWLDLHLIAERTILKHLLAAGVVKGDVESMMEHRVGAVFMPHGLGHFLGLDVHDVGGYSADALPRSTLSGLKSLRTTRTLKAGMFMTVEPGCYFIDALLLPAMADPVLSQFLVEERVHSLRGTGGVRLEDDVIVTETGIENVTRCPREIEDIEAVMAGKEWPSALQEFRLLDNK